MRNPFLAGCLWLSFLALAACGTDSANAGENRDVTGEENNMRLTQLLRVGIWQDGAKVQCAALQLSIIGK